MQPIIHCRPRPVLTPENLREILHYDFDTGIFTWRHRPNVTGSWNARHAGKQAGHRIVARSGRVAYISITVSGWPFAAHRLAVLYVTGKWPEHEVDHRDTNGLNNAWLNLRQATHAQNAHNRGPNRTNKLGIKGVIVEPKTGRFRATIQSEGLLRNLGTFGTAAEAHAAYAAAAQRLHGQFKRTA